MVSKSHFSKYEASFCKPKKEEAVKNFYTSRRLLTLNYHFISCLQKTQLEGTYYRKCSLKIGKNCSNSWCPILHRMYYSVVFQECNFLVKKRGQLSPHARLHTVSESREIYFTAGISRYIPYVRHHNPLLIRNRSWILTIHKARILRKKPLEKTFLSSKSG